MLTRGRSANHVYVAVVGDGDPHTVIQPDNVHLRTATDLLEQILARDTSPQSATTLQREQQDPGVRLAASVERYIDALHVAAEEVIGASAVQALEAFANQLVPGLADEPAWPSMRAHLLLLAVDGKDPHQQLRAVYNTREVGSADDRAAVLDWRLHETSLPSGEGPCRGCPAFPAASPPTPDGDHT
jgi:hypothetical protein